MTVVVVTVIVVRPPSSTVVVVRYRHPSSPVRHPCPYPSTHRRRRRTIIRPSTVVVVCPKQTDSQEQQTTNKPARPTAPSQQPAQPLCPASTSSSGYTRPSSSSYRPDPSSDVRPLTRPTRPTTSYRPVRLLAPLVDRTDRLAGPPSDGRRQTRRPSYAPSSSSSIIRPRLPSTSPVPTVHHPGSSSSACPALVARPGRPGQGARQPSEQQASVARTSQTTANRPEQRQTFFFLPATSCQLTATGQRQLRPARSTDQTPEQLCQPASTAKPAAAVQTTANSICAFVVWVGDQTSQPAQRTTNSCLPLVPYTNWTPALHRRRTPVLSDNQTRQTDQTKLALLTFPDQTNNSACRQTPEPRRQPCRTSLRRRRRQTDVVVICHHRRRR